jgi:DNA-binding Xre family transcriptional regulator
LIKYNKLFALLALRGMKKTDLLTVIKSPTLAKLSKGAGLDTRSIDAICEFLNCQPGDIMSWEHGKIPSKEDIKDQKSAVKDKKGSEK